MYAVISTGGKQYRVKQDDLIEVEFLKGNVGDEVVFDQVLVLADENTVDLGKPSIDGAQVIGKIVEHGKGSKVTVLKFKRRKMYRKRTGHRQLFTAVRIESIASGGTTAAPSQKRTAKSKSKPKDEGKASSEKTPKSVEKKPAEAKTQRAAKKPAVKRSGSAASSAKKRPASKSAPKAKTGKKKPQE